MHEKLAAILQPIFSDIAHSQTGDLGVPGGELAYGYIRVSSSGQAEEGRSGLPRQLLHIHERAQTLNLRIPFDLLYGDDHTGFEFRKRPDLQRLLSDMSQLNRPAHHLIIENLDRLSRNAKWHQGYLLDLFEQHQLTVHFWKAFHSDIERAVLGAISEQGMRHEIERMVNGTRLKAKSGRITAKRPTYGYQFADSQGRLASDPASNYRSDTHYALHPDHAPIMKEIYHRIVGGESLYEICDDLERRGVPTPKRGKHWATGNISKMLKNTTYKGEYTANRYYHCKEWSERSQRMVKRQRQRPEEEWIIVPVPPIVSPEIWDEAQRTLKRNIKRSTRNAKHPCLLQGYMVCAQCENLFIAGGSSGPIVNGERTRRFYLCGSYNHTPTVREHTYCGSPVIYSDVIDPHVWDAVCTLITDPDILIGYIEEEHDKFQRGELNDQLTYLDRQLHRCEQEERQWDQAYGAEIFSLEEYRDKKQAVQQRMDALLVEREKIAEEMAMVELFERKRELVYEHLAMLQEAGFAADLPFKDKRKIVGMLIDQVVIDTQNDWYRLEGVIEGTYRFGDDSALGNGDLDGGKESDFTYRSSP